MATAKATHRLCLQVGSYPVTVDGVEKQKPEYQEIGTVLEIITEDGGRFFELQLSLSILQPTLYTMAKLFNQRKSSSTVRVKMFDIKPKKGKTQPDDSISTDVDDDSIPF